MQNEQVKSTVKNYLFRWHNYTRELSSPITPSEIFFKGENSKLKLEQLE